MKKRIYFDGLNLALPKGTGIATYTRVLTQVTQDLGYENGVLYASRRKPSKDPVMREIGFFDERRSTATSYLQQTWTDVVDQLRCQFTVRPVEMHANGIVVDRQFQGKLPDTHHRFVARNVFSYARYRFDTTGGFLPVEFEQKPDIMHCTYQMALRAVGACNIFTIHDLVPLRLPFTSQDNKRRTYRLLKKIAAEADHIVTVSENSRRDIIDILGVDEKRITNTYQAVSFPQAYTSRPDTIVQEQLSGSFGLDFKEYLLFFGAFEPKKNIGRLIEAYLASGVDIPLVVVTSQGWDNGTEAQVLADQREKQQQSRMAGAPLRRQLVHFEYVGLSMLVTLIRGARAVLFPSLYEGFGLPVLEAMALGTPVVTARSSSLPEVTGDAALLVDPYDVDDIAKAIATVTNDADLRADLSRRGLQQADLFSLPRYRERMERLYAGLC